MPSTTLKLGAPSPGVSCVAGRYRPWYGRTEDLGLGPRCSLKIAPSSVRVSGSLTPSVRVRWVPMRGCIKKCRRCLGSLSKMWRGGTNHWGDLLAVVEYCIDTTPGPHGYTPRDLDRAWSWVCLWKRILKSTLEFEPVSDWARKIFGQYKAVSKVVKDHLASASEARVRLTNRYHREVDLKIGDRVVWRAPGLSDPGAKGRVPWKKGLTGP